MTSIKNRKEVIRNIEISVKNGARIKRSCSLIGISFNTFCRWKNSDFPDKRPTAIKYHPNSLTKDEKDLIENRCTSSEFKDKSPNQIVPILAERGEYIASESSFYKVLRERKLLKYRENTKVPEARKKPPELEATGPNQVFSWDITYLHSKVKGMYFYLYMFLDVWSRKIVGWSVEDRESGDLASKLITNICVENNISDVNLHSDNGAPMKCGTMLATLQKLGVQPSFSRPRVSNDNPFSESLFKTFKYRPGYPSHFNSIEEAQEWVSSFVNWYNTEHRHSEIKFVTPEQRHLGEDIEILKKREKTYELAKKRNPSRWAGKTRDWSRQNTVSLNKTFDKLN